MTTMHDYKTIAAIVGEDKINALREAGVEIGDKPTKPTTGLFGRWAKHPEYGDVLIISEHVKDDGWVRVAIRTNTGEDGSARMLFRLASLTFPEETTRPEDVPVGEAWIVNVGNCTFAAVKAGGVWYSGECGSINNKYVTLVSPLVPARPVDAHREPETVTTEDEYEALPGGSIVAEPHGYPFMKRWDGTDELWVDDDDVYASREMAGTTCQVLRRGWDQ